MARMFSGAVKKRLIEVITPVVENHQAARAQVDSDMIEAFMTPRKMRI